MRGPAVALLSAMSACDAAPAPPACTSGVMQPGTSENLDMTPGQACNACHAYTNASSGDGGDAPIYAFAGTVFTGKHEPDDCVGGPLDDAPAEVEVVDAIGVRYRVPVSAVGNFMFESDAVVYPVTAKILYQGRVRWMIEPQLSGDCNTCHSAAGTDGASGRIRLP